MVTSHSGLVKRQASKYYLGVVLVALWLLELLALHIELNACSLHSLVFNKVPVA
jgi:hypothetical protein